MDVIVLTGIFNFFGDSEKNPEVMFINMTFSSAKFGDFSLKNESRNTKKGRLINGPLCTYLMKQNPHSRTRLRS